MHRRDAKYTYQQVEWASVNGAARALHGLAAKYFQVGKEHEDAETQELFRELAKSVENEALLYEDAAEKIRGTFHV